MSVTEGHCACTAPYGHSTGCPAEDGARVRSEAFRRRLVDRGPELVTELILKQAATHWARLDPDERGDANDPLVKAIPRDVAPSTEVLAAIKAITGKSPDAAGVQHFNGESTRAAWCRYALKRWAAA
ncbi:hypothetical protein GCM10027403_14630 [Arthrobacter tecti]